MFCRSSSPPSFDVVRFHLNSFITISFRLFPVFELQVSHCSVGQVHRIGWVQLNRFCIERNGIFELLGPVAFVAFVLFTSGHDLSLNSGHVSVLINTLFRFDTSMCFHLLHFCGASRSTRPTNWRQSLFSFSVIKHSTFLFGSAGTLQRIVGFINLKAPAQYVSFGFVDNCCWNFFVPIQSNRLWVKSFQLVLASTDQLTEIAVLFESSQYLPQLFRVGAGLHVLKIDRVKVDSAIHV
mmetsp:Transcript_22094/g.31252  ORF Transcript_22094/g.31252 Transcript_22094/m.31252 type:complete len:238 (+) Transcript_22094:2241-2954(+)